MPQDKVIAKTLRKGHTVQKSVVSPKCGSTDRIKIKIKISQCFDENSAKEMLNNLRFLKTKSDENPDLKDLKYEFHFGKWHVGSSLSGSQISMFER